MRRLLPLLICVGGLLWLSSPRAQAGDAQGIESAWTGAKACGTCHQEIFKAWQEGPHAVAAKSLAKRKGDGQCESCHGTGDAPAGRNFLRNVQCEACHGAGRDYSPNDIMRDPVLARALGMRDLASPEKRQELCMRCHLVSTSIMPFDAQAAWLEIAH